MYIDGQWRAGANERDVCDPYRGARVACAPESSVQDLDDGGIRSSGIGREGPRYAMRDMMEERLVLFNL
jgi:acyl-CoA reductase-like NAD-dependent aldehyde dehydrogenase